MHNSFLSYAFLLERYGPRVNLEDLAVILDTTAANLRRRISCQDFDIPTYLDGGRRWVDIRDLSAYLDLRRQQAREAHQRVHGAGLGV